MKLSLLNLFLVASVLAVLLPLPLLAEETDDEKPKAELQIEVLSKPDECPKKTEKGKMIKVHYTGTLEDGVKFDSSWDRGEPLQFQLGSGQVIRGWDQGLLNMCVGEKRKLTIPSHLAYGQKGAGERIPPGATLIFTTELIDVSDEKQKGENIFKEIDADGDNLLSQEEFDVFFALEMKNMSLVMRDESHNRQIATKIFSIEDLNGDGNVTLEEYVSRKYIEEIEEEMELYKKTENSESIIFKDQYDNIYRNK
ncbi:hypothetical protein CAPTEDRAFT_182499 [Capitella teleta]|uniref:peptidylprolyl isomerase n=1 Tax=Capitella teleta TaxID=283909 RepID=R7TG68_CAPTE|nr:hypothetical protein CAPTEDRAFT_182499 [Capitella teleta]|eukprot:ELT92778.1 hypothetical protein CAPTEDRAFT_182499 [Capitella teleta]